MKPIWLAALSLVLFSCSCSNKSKTPTDNPVNTEAKVDSIIEHKTSLVGQKMPDLKLATRYGLKTNISKLSTREYTILAFFNPANEAYRNVFNSMVLNNNISSMIIDGTLTVIAIDTTGDIEELRLMAPYFPNTWYITSCYPDDLKNYSELAELAHANNPMFFLVDKNTDVISQAPNFASLLEIINKETPDTEN